jgi:NAD(P) transhydrogenase subunit beta
VIGACDVVNPAAMEVDGSPISGMPVLLAHESKHVVCCNLDDKPGYSGVDNPLYSSDRTIMLLGDAKKTLKELNHSLAKGTPSDKVLEIVPGVDQISDSISDPISDTVSADQVSAGQVSGQADPKNNLNKALDALIAAEKIIIVPGYGMALAQAQFKVIELSSMLEEMGKEIKFAIHPVAGRMPGHMNVLLAEADVDYDRLFEMAEINSEFSQTDVALVFGACDVVNPTAMEVEGTPISGMPILMAGDARQIIVCNFDEKPGYSGVENSLYQNPKTIMLSGDAAATALDLINGLISLK